jgi:hypothetical protein
MPRHDFIQSGTFGRRSSVNEYCATNQHAPCLMRPSYTTDSLAEIDIPSFFNSRVNALTSTSWGESGAASKPVHTVQDRQLTGSVNKMGSHLLATKGQNEMGVSNCKGSTVHSAPDALQPVESGSLKHARPFNATEWPVWRQLDRQSPS